MNDTNTDLAEETQPNQDEPKFHFSLVLAEVIFQTNKGVNSHRCQLFSKADVDTFPASRLGQLQNSAASQIQAQVEDKGFKALEVVILNIQSLGLLTDLEFWGSRDAIPGNQPEAPAPQESSSNSAGSAQEDDQKDGNVVELRRP